MKNESSKAKERIAHTVRVITAPPFMIAYLLVVLNFTATDFFIRKTDYLIAWIGLVIFPLMAYPIHRLVPALYSKGRDCQRKLAFIFSLIGYVICFIYGIICGKGKSQIFYFVYFITVALLTITNKLIKIRASGHTASSISPAVFSFIYSKPIFGLLFLMLFFLSIWASLYLRRHKLIDIIAGLLCFVIALLISIITQGVA